MNAELAKSCPLDVNQYTFDSSHTKAFLLLQSHISRLPLPCVDYLTDTKSVLDQAIRILQVCVCMCVCVCVCMCVCVCVYLVVMCVGRVVFVLSHLHIYYLLSSLLLKSWIFVALVTFTLSLFSCFYMGKVCVCVCVCVFFFFFFSLSLSLSLSCLSSSFFQFVFVSSCCSVLCLCVRTCLCMCVLFMYVNLVYVSFLPFFLLSLLPLIPLS